MNVFKYFINKTFTTIFLIVFSVSLFVIVAFYSSFYLIYESVLDDHKHRYFSEKAHQMSFIFRTGYDLTNGELSDNEELFNQMTQEFATPVEFISHDHKETIYSSQLNYEEFEDLYTIELPIVKEGKTIGFLRTFFDMNQDISSPSVVALENKLNIWLNNITVIAIIITFIASLIIARKYARKIDESTLYAVQIMKGNREVLVPRNGTNEINLIIDSINYLLMEFNNMEVWRKRMMEDLTHELRTPLTSVLTRVEAIIDGIYPNTEENLQEIYDELERFSRLVNNVQQLSEAESAKFKLNIKKVSIVHLVRDVYKGFLFMAKEKNINMHFINPNTPCNVYVDPDRMIQVITNLISNALKYTPAGGHVWLRFHIEEDHFIFYCQDTGVGIGEDEIELIFKRFYRIDKSRSRENGGSGIGLSISKALVHAHGGKIGVESKEGKGSEFWVKIPLDNQLISKVDDREQQGSVNHALFDYS